MAIVSQSLGNTSTYVEKMNRRDSYARPSWKHLHIRGENSVTATTRSTGGETPPHTWRKFLCSTLDKNFLGNTSTYVEKIHQSEQSNCLAKKHLHIRGENHPPFFDLSSFMRNTSTYVEKIKLCDHGVSVGRKHLHIRGEN